MAEPVQKGSSFLRFFLRLRFHWHNLAFTLQGLLTLFYSALFSVIEAKFDYYGMKPFATHYMFYDICVVCFIVIVFTFTSMTYILLLEEEKGREAYPNIIGCQLISAAALLAVLGVPMNLLFVFYLPPRMRIVGYITFSILGVFILGVTVFGYWYDWYFPGGNGGDDESDGDDDSDGDEETENPPKTDGRDTEEIPRLEEEDAGKHQQKIDIPKITQPKRASEEEDAGKHQLKIDIPKITQLKRASSSTPHSHPQSKGVKPAILTSLTRRIHKQEATKVSSVGRGNRWRF